MAKEDQLLSKSYKNFLKEIKKKIQTSQVKAVLSVNQELIVSFIGRLAELYTKSSKKKAGALKPSKS